MYFEVEKNSIVKKYNEIWNWVSKIIEKYTAGFWRRMFENVYFQSIITLKTIHTFSNKKVPGENFNSLCIPIIVFDSICKIKKANTRKYF